MNKIIRSMRKTYVPAFCLLLLFAAVPPGAVHAEGDRPVRIAYTDWADSVANANIVRAVLQEEMGIRCNLVMMGADEMWEAVAAGEVDAMVSAWLPDTHAHYKKAFGDRVVDLGPNVTGARTGLVVPDVRLGRLAAGAGIRQSYITIDAIGEMKDHADKFNRRIIGIEPEAGIMRQASEALEIYDLDEDFELVRGSESEMIDALSMAIRHQRWIVVTGWVPHWSFAKWNLKFLEDPENVFGEPGYIHTLVREGLEEQQPEVYRFLDNFYWEPEDIGQVMLWIEDDRGRFPYDKALRWIRANPDTVRNWTGQ